MKRDRASEAVQGRTSGHLGPGTLLVAFLIVCATVLVLLVLGRTLICTCGTVKIWHGEVFSSENSQHIADWYSPSHFVHGILFFGLLSWLAGRLSVGVRFKLAILAEAGWEILENTDFIIRRYRELTVSFDYFGDSIVNSVSDIGFMGAGFLLAWRAPVWVSILVGVILELLAAFVIRDNLTLNIIMLLFPVDAIKTWQMG